MCRWWKLAWHAYKNKPCTLELKPPPACSLACQVSHLIVPLFDPFGKPQVGDLVTRRHFLTAHDLHMLWSTVDCCAGAKRQTKCLVSEKKDAFAFAGNIHFILALPSGLPGFWHCAASHACTAAPRKKRNSKTAGGQVPAATLDLFRRLLAVLDRGQNQDALRPHLYAALLSFMQYSHGRHPAQASPHILTALLKAGTIPNAYGSGQVWLHIATMTAII